MRAIPAFILLAGVLAGQTPIAPVIEGGASAPTSPCTTGEIYFHHGAAAGRNLFVCASGGWSQINGTAETAVPGGVVLPASCSTGQLFLKTDADPSRTLHVCSATNTWSQTAYGQGTAAQKPATCSAGQIYFSTDVPAGQNLSLCTSSNTWTATGLGGSGAANQMTYFSGANTLASDNKITRNSSGDLSANSFLAGPATYGQYFATNLLGVTFTVDSRTCTAGSATATASYSFHRINLNSQTTCTISWASGSVGQSAVTVLLCNGSTPTTAVVWPANVAGGMPAGGAANQCAAQTFIYDAVNARWYATSSGSNWN